MKRLTRRAALAALSAASFGPVAATTRAAAPEAGAAKHELFVVGPFCLGDWFKEYRERKKARRPIVAGAPDDAEIIESLNDCKLYVIDRRVWKDKDTVRFDDSQDAYPKLVAEGKLRHFWDEKGMNCTIWVTRLALAGSKTNHRTPPPFREASWNVAIDIRGEKATVVETASYAFMSDRPTSYDITGKLLLGQR
jgi:hypothetical protein